MKDMKDMKKEKNFLIVVDMQNDFIDGSLGTQEAQAMTPDAVRRIRACREAGWTLIATQDTHGENYLDTAEGRKLPVLHCVKGTEGWRLQKDVQEALDSAVLIEKPAFGSEKLPWIVESLLQPDETPRIELLGLCTDICVISNALLLKAHFPEADIAVNARCCAGVTPQKHQAALLTMASCQIDLID